MNGRYRDLIGLDRVRRRGLRRHAVHHDYDNILLSLSLIGDRTEFMMFPDQGTTIAMAIEQGIGLFKAFDFLDASGNLMLMFTDGEDTQAMIHGKNLERIVEGAVADQDSGVYGPHEL